MITNRTRRTLTNLVTAVCVAAALGLTIGVFLAPAQPRSPAPASVPMGDPAAEYVPLCEDVPDGTGPCVTSDELHGALRWFYVAPGHTYPGGRQTVSACRTEDGGPVPCVWVPSAMGEHRNPGDSGAYVYR